MTGERKRLMKKENTQKGKETVNPQGFKIDAPKRDNKYEKQSETEICLRGREKRARGSELTE